MTEEETRALGIDDAMLSKSFREGYGFVPPLLAGNGRAAVARRREVFDRVMLKWYAPTPPPPPDRTTR